MVEVVVYVAVMDMVVFIVLVRVLVCVMLSLSSVVDCLIFYEGGRDLSFFLQTPFCEEGISRIKLEYFKSNPVSFKDFDRYLL